MATGSANVSGGSVTAEMLHGSAELELSLQAPIIMGETFEHRSIFFALTHWLVLLITWIVTVKKKLSPGKTFEQNFGWCDGITPKVAAIRKNAARSPALNVIYNWQRDRGFKGLIEAYWFNLPNCQALRNRYRIVRRTLHEQIQHAISRDGEARILSLACGSAQSVFEAAHGYEHVHIMLIDQDPEALSFARQMADHYKVADVIFVTGNALSPSQYASEFQPNIVEVVGLFDYLSDLMIIGLLKRIQKVMAPGGCIITAHIHPNNEAHFLEVVAEWEMRYRSEDELRDVISQSGIPAPRYIKEPFGIHTVVISRDG